MSHDPGRRGLLKKATLAIGAAIGAAAAMPVVRYLVFPVARKVVDSAEEPVDVAGSASIEAGGPPQLVQVRAKNVRDAWSSTTDVALGAAWLLRDRDGALTAFTSACPHLGCAVGYDAAQQRFACPCHTSSFDRDGKKLSGPAKRGLDPLPVKEKNGRVLLTYKTFRTDIAERQET